MLNTLILLSPEKMQPWGHPKILPPGAQDYILLGNPEKSELYTFRFQLPAHYQIPPFKLTALCCMTVLSGELYIGQGDRFEKKNYHAMSAGSFIIIPTDTPLYFWTQEKTVLQFHGIGPINFIYMNS